MIKYKLVLLFGLCFILFSCTTQKACLRKYPPEIKLIIKDSIVYKIDTIRETFTVTLYDTIIRHIKADTVYLTGSHDKDSSYLENEYSISIAKIQYNSLIHYLEQKEQVRPVTGEWAAEIAHHYKEYYQSRSETKIIKEKYIPKFWKITGFIGIALILIICVYLFFKIKAGWLSNISRVLR